MFSFWWMNILRMLRSSVVDHVELAQSFSQTCLEVIVNFGEQTNERRLRQNLVDDLIDAIDLRAYGAKAIRRYGCDHFVAREMIAKYLVHHEYELVVELYQVFVVVLFQIRFIIDFIDLFQSFLLLLLIKKMNKIWLLFDTPMSFVNCFSVFDCFSLRRFLKKSFSMGKKKSTSSSDRCVIASVLNVMSRRTPCLTAPASRIILYDIELNILAEKRKQNLKKNVPS